MTICLAVRVQMGRQMDATKYIISRFRIASQVNIFKSQLQE